MRRVHDKRQKVSVVQGSNVLDGNAFSVRVECVTSDEKSVILGSNVLHGNACSVSVECVTI